MIIFQGKEYPLKFDFNALCKVEDVLNISIADLETNSSLRVLRVLVWAGLLDAIPNLTIEEAGEACQETGLDNLQELVTDSLESAFGGKSDSKKK